MLGRLPIFLAQLKAGNNSQKLKNEMVFCHFQKTFGYKHGKNLMDTGEKNRIRCFKNSF